MKILNINSYYLSSSLYQPMEDSLIKKELDISTYVPIHSSYKPRDEIVFPLPNHITIDRCFNKIDRLFFNLKHYKILNNLNKKYDVKKYDVLHAHSLFSNGYVAYKVFKKTKVPYIVAVRSSDINVFFKKMIHLRKLGLSILLNAQKVIFLSESHKKECVNNYIPKKHYSEISKKIIVIPNGIDKYWFENKGVPSNPNPNKIKLLFVGNDSRRKNLKTLMEACEVLLRLKYNVELSVVGKVSQKTKLILNEKTYIKTFGQVDKERLLGIYRENDIFVLPSITETFGLVYPESMAQGLPIIYTKGQGFDGYFGDGVVGYSVDPLNSKEIASRILDVLSNYRLQSRNCIRFCHQFNWELISQEYLNIYNDIYSH